MKILILANNDMGLYKFRKELLETLVKEHSVHVAIPDGEYVEKIELIGCDCHVLTINRRGTNIFQDMGLLLKYMKMLKKEKPDIVLTYTVKPNIYGGIACRIEKIPYLANVTGLGTAIENPGFFSKFVLKLYKIGLAKAECVFFQNKNNLEFMRRKKISGKKAILLPGSGVNLIQHCQEEYPATDQKLILLFVGRLMRDKGVGEFVQAAKILSEKYDFLHFQLVGDCEAEYESVLRDLEADKYAELCGRQDDVHKYMKNAHVIVLPSYHEGMANVLLEAAACGRPILASNVPGCKETFEEGVSGYGFEAENVDSLVNAIEKFISLDHTQKAQMGINGRKKMEAEFSRQIIIDKYVEEIKRVKER